MRNFGIWLVAAVSTACLLALAVPSSGGPLPPADGASLVGRLLMVAIPLNFGLILGLGCPGPATWAILLATALVPAIAMARVDPWAFARVLAVAFLAPAPFAAAAGWAARRLGLDERKRLYAALLAAIAILGFFAVMEALHLIPRAFVIIDPIGAP